MQINLNVSKKILKAGYQRRHIVLSYWSPDDFSIIVIIVGKNEKNKHSGKKLTRTPNLHPQKNSPGRPICTPKKSHPDAPFAPPKIFLKEVRMKKNKLKKPVSAHV